MAFGIPLITAGLQVGKALAGLFGKKKKPPRPPTPASNIMSQAVGVLDAAEKTGFNPLTLLQYGNPGGTGLAAPGAPPPLASIDALTDGLRGLDDVLSGDADRRRAADQAEIDLAKVKIEAARGELARVTRSPSRLDVARAAPVRAVDRVHRVPSPLGRRAVPVPTVSGTVHATARAGLATPPPQHPVARARELQPVIYPDGAVVEMPRGVAARLNLKPWDTLTAGDLEELRGEAVGNAESTARAYDLWKYSMGGKPRKVEPKKTPVYSPPLLRKDG